MGGGERGRESDNHEAEEEEEERSSSLVHPVQSNESIK